tara:strand:- start:240 stop:392 length:153 start_codon:yes stop_codon:yes gene_type:complete
MTAAVSHVIIAFDFYFFWEKFNNSMAFITRFVLGFGGFYNFGHVIFLFIV